MAGPTDEPHFDVRFKRVKGVDLVASIFPASKLAAAPPRAPLALYFHSGGLTGGSRLGFFPQWLPRFLNEKGIHFATVDYRLIPTCIIQELREDLLDAFRYLIGTEAEGRLLSHGALPVNTQRTILIGASAGGYCANILLQAVLRDQDLPRPVALLTLYAELNIASSFYNKPKAGNDRVGKLTTPRPLSEVDHLFRLDRMPVVGADVKWFTVPFEEARTTSEREAYDQTNLTNTIMNEGLTAQVLLGVPELSTALRDQGIEFDTDLNLQKMRIPQVLHEWFPLLQISTDYPRTLVLHGEADVAIPLQDAEVFADALKTHQVEHRFVTVHGQAAGHGFDRQGIDRWWERYIQPNMLWLLEPVLQ